MDAERSRKNKGNIKRVLKYNLPLILVGCAIICIIVIVISIVMAMKKINPSKKGFAQSDRIECPGFTDKITCEEHHCTYQDVQVGPSCYMTKNKFSFEVQNVTEEENGITIHMKNKFSETPYGKSLDNVTFKLTYLTENILRFQFKDSDEDRYEVPVQEYFPLLKSLIKVNKGNLSYEVTHTNISDVFNFEVKRKNGTYIWDTRIGGLLLSDQYLQIASYLPSKNVYGLGEHVRDKFKHDMIFVSWPMFARDSPAEGGRKNLYGVHPFYTCLEKDGKSHGVFLLNSNAMEATFMPQPAISFRTIGGILDFFIFVGDNPEHVIQLYTSLIGRPMMPPYWGLGFHLSRFGYDRMDDLEKTVTRTLKSKIPIAVQYLDIDHMEDFKDFTYDQDTFAGLGTYIEKTKKENGIKWVIILDPGIEVDNQYQPYSSGLNESVFIKRNPSWKKSMFPIPQDVTLGHVWPLYHVAFPDFFLNSTKEWWSYWIQEHRRTISFDALWIDMNEPANFGTNMENPPYCSAYGDKGDCWSLKCPTSSHDDPPYNPLYKIREARLSEQTLCMDSVQGDSKSPYSHYNVHSLYGWSQTPPTLEAVRTATNSRSFVITRSTYPSSGAYAGHWLGDNESTYKDLRRSIIGILDFNLFGIPYVGADVCGFYGDVGPDLCKRWMQLGAYYPYFRNHNSKNARDQDPAALGSDVEANSKRAIERRIMLNPILYTLFYKAHVYGNTVVRPLFHEFPNDEITFSIDRQFMWGSVLLISPVLAKDAMSLSLYLPKDEWWRFHMEGSWKEPYSERYVIATDADEYAPLHVRGGSIIPLDKHYQVPLPKKSDSLNITLFVYPKERMAAGDMFVDDGVSIDTIENEAYSIYDFSHENCSVKINTQKKVNFTRPIVYLDAVVVFHVTNIETANIGSKNTTFTTDEVHKSSTINVGDTMKNVPEITWKTTDGKC